MAGSVNRPRLHVEGTDDKHSIIHLLLRHGVDYETNAKCADIRKIGGVPELLDGIEPAVLANANRPIGFVLDADSPLASRWESVADCLKRVDVDTPDSPPTEGFIGKSSRYGSMVGVWLMPDNQQPGMLEDFLETLIANDDSIIGFASTTTDEARDTHGAKFKNKDVIKAKLHAWLAWQKEPGRPFGTAIKAEFFGHDSPVATTFVTWYKRLYEID